MNNKAKIKELFRSKYWIVFLAIYCVGYLFMMSRFGQVELDEALLFLLSQIAFVLIPGMALSLLICPQREIVKTVIVSYMMGIAIVILEYYIFYGLKAKDFLPVGMAAVALISVILLVKKRSVLKSMEMNHGSAWALSLLLAAFCTLVFFSAVYPSRVPDLTGHENVSYYQDLIWNAGNTTAIANGLPVMDIHISGLTFSYHFLTNVFLAAFHNVLGISSFVLYCKLLPILQVVVFTGALYLLYSLLSKKVWIRALLTALTFGCSLVFLWHMLWQAYATIFALSFTVLAAYFFIKAFSKLDRGKLLGRDFWAFAIFLCIAIGTKSLFAGVLVAGAGIIMLIMIFRRKQALQMLLGGIIMLGVLAFMILAMVWGVNGFNGLSIQLFTPLLGDNPWYYQTAAASMGPGGAALLCYPLYLFLSHPLLVIAAVLLIVYLARCKNGDRAIAAFLLGAIATGIIAAAVLFQPGYSNALFMEAAVPFAVFSVYYTGAAMWRSGLEKKKKTVVACLVAAGLVFAVIPNVVNVAQNWMLNSSTRVASTWDSISYYEYEGMEWLRQNTPEDAVVVSDRIYYVPEASANNARYFYYTAFSERQNYLEGYYYVNSYSDDFEQVIDQKLKMIQKVYAGDQYALAQLVSEGADYLVSSKSMTEGFVFDSRYGDVVFKNDGITIYQLKEEND